MSKSKKKSKKGSAAAKGSVLALVEEDYGHYRIKAGKLGAAFVARAFPQAASGARGVIAEAQGDSEYTAIEKLKTLIEERRARWVAERRKDERCVIAVPSEAEYAEALDFARLSSAQVAMLKAHAVSSELGLTAGELASAGGYSSGTTASKNLKKTSGYLASHLGIDLPADDDGDLSCVLAVRGDARNGTNQHVWVMHPELRNAVNDCL